MASARLDNLLSCWAGLHALVGTAATVEPAAPVVRVVCLFDHEEVGSASTTGAAGPVLEHVLERSVAARGGARDDLLRALARSACASADGAHATHPNYPERHEPGHLVAIDGGPVVKVNANQRYTTEGPSAARWLRVCRTAGVPTQPFVSNNAVPCGSTIGPITATRLGITTVDVGVPLLSMHSARELVGVQDAWWLAEALTAFYSGAGA